MPPMVARDAVEMSTGYHRPCGFKLPVEFVEHDAGLHRAAPAGDVEIEDAVEVLRAVHHQRWADGLAALRGAAAARQHRHPLRTRNRNGPIGLLDGPRRHHADRHDLVVRSVGRVAAAGEPIETHVPGQFGLQPPFQAGHDYSHGINP